MNGIADKGSVTCDWAGGGHNGNGEPWGRGVFGSKGTEALAGPHAGPVCMGDAKDMCHVRFTCAHTHGG